MIKTQREYDEARRRVEHDRELLHNQRRALEAAGLSPEEVDRGLAPLRSFHAQLRGEIEWYENARRGALDRFDHLNSIGRLLIAARIASNISQRELADRLEVSETQVSRDERNEYYNVTVERAQRILYALGKDVELRFHELEVAD